MQNDNDMKEKDKNFSLTMPKSKREIIRAVIEAIIVIAIGIIAVFVF